MPPPWSAGEPTPTLAQSRQHEEVPNYARGTDHQALAQSKPLPFFPPAPSSHLASQNAAVDPTSARSAPPYTASSLPTPVAVLTAPAYPAPSHDPTRWSNQMTQMARGHPAMPTPIAMPFAQTHSRTVPGPLQHTAPAPAPAPAPPLHINTNFTGEHHVPPSQSQIAAPGSWSPWAVPCPEIVVDSDLLLSSIDHPGSARSTTSSISSHDPFHYAYLLAHQSPVSSSGHYSPYSDLSVVTPSSLMFDFENSQNMLSSLASHPESSVPNIGFDARLLPTLPSSKSPHESQFRSNSEAAPSSRTGEPEDPPYVTGPHFGMLQGLGQRNTTENSSDSTLRLSLGQTPYSAGPAPAFPVAQTMAPAPSFPIPETVEDHDDDPVPEYTEAGPNKRRRKGEAISSVPLKECFMGDALRRTLILRVLAKPWLREHRVEPVFLSTDDDVTIGLEKQVAWAFDMKKGDSLFKAFEGPAGKCPFDGCPNVEPRAHRRISHVRTHFGLRPFSCDPRGCARCQARVERGLEYVLLLFCWACSTATLTRLPPPLRPTGSGASTTWTVSESIASLWN